MLERQRGSHEKAFQLQWFYGEKEIDEPLFEQLLILRFAKFSILCYHMKVLVRTYFCDSLWHFKESSIFFFPE